MLLDSVDELTELTDIVLLKVDALLGVRLLRLVVVADWVELLTLLNVD